MKIKVTCPIVIISLMYEKKKTYGTFFFPFLLSKNLKFLK